ncbi:hypothetical protein [Bradyrhizobium sp. JYMT SZCCT0428]|uniref:hypothetical protein n=1 Tax=Bradyrhizobium sp. JYMT SZCCT0428 TaxID=2807673 RepID=UPI001BADEED5|nr:hypothetical protein [Bradyrhizobium sp. JYMT SZCCT0428]MBR1157170.1 hypothetical protein [Bradyrhizobium sp. JYMT SZCCT0428]
MDASDDPRRLTGHAARDGFEFGIVQFAHVVHVLPCFLWDGTIPATCESQVYESPRLITVTAITFATTKGKELGKSLKSGFGFQPYLPEGQSHQLSPHLNCGD